MVRRTTGFCLILLMLMVWLGPACQQGAPSLEDFYHIRKIKLNEDAKTHILQLGRQALGGEKAKKDVERFKMVYRDEPRGVFLTLLRPHEAALTTFGFGDSMAQAIEEAGATMTQLAAREDMPKLILRVDVIDESLGEKSREVDKKWAIDLSRDGIIFDTKPVAAFLPEELRDWAVIDKKKQYHFSSMKRLIKQRSLGKVLYDQLSPKTRVKYTRFTAISFMEGDGNSAIDLLRGNRLDGFEATPERLYQAIDAAGKYLAKAVREDGKFDYLYFPQTHKFSKSYNELRHGGTAFSMAQIYQVTQDPELLAAIKRSLDYLDRTSMGPDPEDSRRYDWRAVAEPKRLYSKLGGAGLALLAFGTYTQVTGDMQYMDLMRDYGKFIEYMQEENGDMRMRYWRRPEDKGRETEPVLYYPGEAFFGLSKLYHLDNKNERWLKVAVKGIDYIIDIRDVDKPTKSLPHDHWLMYAINEWYQVQPKKSHLDHAYRVTEAMMKRFIYKHEFPDFVGGFLSRPQTTPSACRLEGASATYRLAQHVEDREQMMRLYEAMVLGSSFLMRNQYNPINTMFFRNPEKAMGGYMASYWNPEIQIDFVQHSTSALIAAREIIMEKQQQETEEPAAIEEEAA